MSHPELCQLVLLYQFFSSPLAAKVAMMWRSVLMLSLVCFMFGSVNGLGGKRLMCYFSSDSPKTKGYGRYTANEIPLELCSDVIYRGISFPEWRRGSYFFDVRAILHVLESQNDVLMSVVFTSRTQKYNS